MQPFAVLRLHIPIVEKSRSTMVAQEPVVLLVSDDEDLRAVAARALQNQGYRVLAAAHSGHAVLACWENGRVDVLVTELSMPDISGPALGRRLRRCDPDLPVIYLARTGTPRREGVLVRPFTCDDLVRELDAAVSTTRGLASI